jgi:hypothetical protein
MNAASANPPSQRRAEIHLAAAQSPDAFDIWHAALAPMFDVALAGDKPVPFRGDVVGFHLGECLTFNNASVGQRLVRTPALARSSALDHVMIHNRFYADMSLLFQTFIRDKPLYCLTSLPMPPNVGDTG